MTNDQLITTDLTALGSHSRRRVLALDAVLEPHGVPAERVDTVVALDLVAIGRVFAHRVARTTAGGALVAATLTLLALTGLQSYKPGPEMVPTLLDVSVRSMAVLLLAVALAAYLVGLRAGDHVFGRRLREADPLAAGRRAVRAIDGWAVGLGIAGITMVATLLGSMFFALGGESWVLAIFDDPTNIGSAFTDRVRDVTVGAGFAFAIAMYVGRACTRDRSWIPMLEHRWVLAAGIVIGAVTLYLGFTLDVGPIKVTFESLRFPSDHLRRGLTVGGVTALVVTTTCFTLRRRRREQSRCGLE